MNRINLSNFNRFKKPISGCITVCTLSLLITVGVSASPTVAHADLKVCNNTSSKVGVSLGYRLKAGWKTEGWWHIPAKVCTSLIEGDLNSRYFYLHAEDVETGGRWRGPIFMCTSSKQYKIDGLKDCFSRGFERAGFFEVDTRDQKNWQVRLTEASKTKKDAKSK
ncbi:MAG: DUF1036 domain-containing protein [Rhizobiaceae bacterium]